MARSTRSRSHGMAQKALKFNEDMTFSPDEIDMLLPIGLRKNNGLKGPPARTSTCLVTCCVFLPNGFGRKRGSPRPVALQTRHTDFCMQWGNTYSAWVSAGSLIEPRW